MNHTAIAFARCIALSAFVGALPLSAAAGIAPHRYTHADDSAGHESFEHSDGCPSSFEGLVFKREAVNGYRAHSEGAGNSARLLYAGPSQRESQSAGQQTCREHWRPMPGDDLTARR